jgi:hypothetical protein
LFKASLLLFLMTMCNIGKYSSISEIDLFNSKQAPVSDTLKTEYKIDDKLVSQQEFDTFKSVLKELSETWFCAETNKGGITGYDMVDTKGVVYQFRAESENGSSKISLGKKEILESIDR